MDPIITPEQETANAATTSITCANLLKNASMIALLEDYAKHLLKTGKVDNKHDIQNQITELISFAMDQGDCTVAVLSHFKKWLANYQQTTYHQECIKFQSQFIEHVLVEELPELVDQETRSQFTEDEAKQYADLEAACVRYKQVVAAWTGKYTSTIMHVSIEFVNKYRKFFDDEFVTKLTKGREDSNI